MNGILNVYKEPGFTSFDVVAKLRRILKQKKIGHTGTLDPAAQGVLPVCLGKATKLCDLITDGSKTYEAVMLLGKTTDTLDMEGTVLSENEASCTDDEVRAAIMSFVGHCEQIPPMYSALKVDGKRLYELARQGISVERKSRSVDIYEIEILYIDLPRAAFRVRCSKGTYIRTLCDDIGRQLGCGACMESLKRTASGRFEEKDAHRLSEIERLMDEGKLDSVIIGMDEVFSRLPEYRAIKSEDKALHNGNKLHIGNAFEDKGHIRVYDSNDEFIGIFRFEARENILKPVKILYEKDARE